MICRVIRINILINCPGRWFRRAYFATHSTLWNVNGSGSHWRVTTMLRRDYRVKAKSRYGLELNYARRSVRRRLNCLCICVIESSLSVTLTYDLMISNWRKWCFRIRILFIDPLIESQNKIRLFRRFLLCFDSLNISL